MTDPPIAAPSMTDPRITDPRQPADPRITDPRITDPRITDPRQPADLLFGVNLVAMVTPMSPDGAVSEPGVAGLVDHLLATGCDGIVVGGTTGESPTLTDDEAAGLVRAVAARAGGRARVVAGVGTYDTAASVRRAREARAAGADALLLVCPYYSRPTQAGVVAHCLAVADATDLPVMLYDVPARTGIAMSEATLAELARHPRIRAVKDAKGDLFEAMSVMDRTSLAYYCGIDELNLPYLACGATGVLSVVGNVVADRNAELVRAVRGGDLGHARAIHRSLAPFVAAVMRTSPGAVMAKAALAELGTIPHATVRLPLVEAPPAHLGGLRDALAAIAVPRRSGAAAGPAHLTTAATADTSTRAPGTPRADTSAAVTSGGGAAAARDAAAAP